MLGTLSVSGVGQSLGSVVRETATGVHEDMGRGRCQHGRGLQFLYVDVS